MSEHEAFLAMFAFLEAEYELSKSDGIGALLGTMSLLPDGQPSDPAIFEQWREACRKVERGEVNATLQITK